MVTPRHPILPPPPSSMIKSLKFAQWFLGRIHLFESDGLLLSKGLKVVSFNRSYVSLLYITDSIQWGWSHALRKLDSHSLFLEFQLLPELCLLEKMVPGFGNTGSRFGSPGPCNRDAKGIHLSLKNCFFINKTENDVFENSKQKFIVLLNEG